MLYTRPPSARQPALLLLLANALSPTEPHQIHPPDPNTRSYHQNLPTRPKDPDLAFESYIGATLKQPRRHLGRHLRATLEELGSSFLSSHESILAAEVSIPLSGYHIEQPISEINQSFSSPLILFHHFHLPVPPFYSANATKSILLFSQPRFHLTNLSLFPS